MAMTFQVVPAGMLSTTYDVLADGLPKGRIEHRTFSLRDEAVITTPDRTLTAHREKVFRSAAVLESPEGTLRGKAEKESFWREHFRVQYEDITLFLRQKPMSWRGVFVISDGSGDIGGIRLEKLLSRRMLVEFTTESPPPLEITEFMVWIVLTVQRRQAAAS
jgi:hypothetical protein